VRSLTIRADGGPGIGVGHLARGLALAEAWVDRGGAATLVTDSPPGHWAERFRAEGVDVRPPGAEPPAADWVAVDGYHLAGARPLGDRLLVVDDHGHAGEAGVAGVAGEPRADLVVDQNLGATAAPYPGARELLLGPRYALLRREFGRHAPPPGGSQPERARRLLVAMGGAPAAEFRALLDATLADPRLAGLAVIRLEGVTDVADAMAGADVALSASGTTCWELCCMGVPAVLAPVAPNQVPLATALAAEGVAVAAGPRDDLAALVAGLAADPDRRRAMVARGRALVDGRGARRTATRMLSHLVDLRPATARDADRLWKWANDPVTRAASFTTDPIPWETHVAWLARRLADPDSHIFMSERGVVRFEGGVISVAVAPEARRQGLGAALIDAGVRRLFATTGTATVVARIKPDNVASRVVFEDADFSPAGEHYERRRDGDRAPCLSSS